MKTRVVSALIMLPLLILVWLGGIWLQLAAFVISLIGMFEFYRAFNAGGIKSSPSVGYVFLIFLHILIFYSFHIHGGPLLYNTYNGAWFFALFAVCMINIIIGKEHNVYEGLVTLLGVVYIGYFMAHIIFIDMLPKDRNLIWLCFISAFGTDICAYFGGYLFGKHKLAPVLSPKKTIEGSVAGVFGSTLLCVLFGILLDKNYIVLCIVVGIVGSLAAQAGDLTASAFKRRLGIKDYGNLIPGHGGIMDRFDSLIFTVPFVYYCLIFFVERAV